MKPNYKMLIICLIIGIAFGWFVAPSGYDTTEINTETADTVFVKDTVYVDPIKPVIFEPSIPDVIETTSRGLVRSSKTFETEFVDIKVTALAECSVELFTLELLNIRPMPIEIQERIVTIEKLKTIYIEPKWHNTRTTGIVIGVLGTLTAIWAVGQIAK